MVMIPEIHSVSWVCYLAGCPWWGRGTANRGPKTPSTSPWQTADLRLWWPPSEKTVRSVHWPVELRRKWKHHYQKNLEYKKIKNKNPTVSLPPRWNMAMVVEVTHDVVLVRTPKWLWMSRKKRPKFLRTAPVRPMMKKADMTTTQP